MKLVFFGTPEYVLPILRKIHKEFGFRFGQFAVVAVVTQKPKPTGRKKMVSYSPVDKWAYKHKVPVFYNAQDLLKSPLAPDIGILAAYGEIISKEVLNFFPKGILNVHPSLLPSYRGASPVQATLINGDRTTGVSIIKLDEDIDHGPIVAQFTQEVLENDTCNLLRDHLFDKSSQVLVDLLEPYIKGKINLKSQDHSKATFTTRITKEHGFISPKYLAPTLQGKTFKGKWKIPFIKNCSLVPNAYCLERFIRAMLPWPIAWTYIQLTGHGSQSTVKRFKILSAHVEELVPNRYCLMPDLVQLEGKDLVSWKQFKEAYATAIFE